MGFTAIIEDTLGGRRFSGINVSHDTEITIVLNCVDAGH
jgi:hypothetical protein